MHTAIGAEMSQLLWKIKQFSSIQQCFFCSIQQYFFCSIQQCFFCFSSSIFLVQFLRLQHA